MTDAVCSIKYEARITNVVQLARRNLNIFIRRFQTRTHQANFSMLKTTAVHVILTQIFTCNAGTMSSPSVMFYVFTLIDIFAWKFCIFIYRAAFVAYFNRVKRRLGNMQLSSSLTRGVENVFGLVPTDRLIDGNLFHFLSVVRYSRYYASVEYFLNLLFTFSVKERMKIEWCCVRVISWIKTPDFFRHYWNLNAYYVFLKFNFPARLRFVWYPCHLNSNNWSQHQWFTKIFISFL